MSAARGAAQTSVARVDVLKALDAAQKVIADKIGGAAASVNGLTQVSPFADWGRFFEGRCVEVCQ